MSFPDPISCTPMGGTYLTSALPSTWSFNQFFTVGSTANWREVDGSGYVTQNPIGQSGPFVVEIEGEGILCASVSGNTVYVYQDSSINGRGYSGSAVAHSIGVATKQNLTIIATSAQSVEEGGDVTSVFGRSGAVVAAPGDYTAAQVTNAVSSLVVSQTLVANAVTVAAGTQSALLTNNSSATATITLATAGAVDGQFMWVRFLDSAAAAETLTWVNTENSTVSVQTTSNGSTTLPTTTLFMFNAATSKWRTVLKA